MSILAEAYVAWVDANVSRHGTQEAARSYAEFLFTDTAQHIIGELGYRPYKPVDGGASPRPPIVLFPITAIARDWDDAQQQFFADNGIIDAVLPEAPR